ncbi:ATP-binding protein [Psychroserpens luteus]|uniref:ATP-binding protein n=1 Tax=Psychroserpens luteus TaxID=1434066 RepID=A0ABW5ZQ25_9FLAO|nr:ATP-binding protein [Psychroserpens luteus]
MSNTSNAKTIEQELKWFQNYVNQKLAFHFTQSSDEHIQSAPKIDDHDSPYANVIKTYKLTEAERLILILALVPHIRPSALDFLFQKNKTYDKPFSEFGGRTIKGYNGILPTGETALFLLDSEDIEKRLSMMSLFNENHKLFRDGILEFAATTQNLPLYSRQLILSQQYLSLFTNQEPNIKAHPGFRATKLSTLQDWDDLVVSHDTHESIKELKLYLNHSQDLKTDYKFNKHMPKGHRVLFAGPHGTGKTMTATLLGKSANRDVYRVDLSLVISNFIGETEKNLDRLFKQAESQNWILFFDEADALFGKRTNVKDAHDRYANQEVSYLLQRIEDFDGLIILSTDLAKNIDAAFVRRFQSIITFHMPDTEERLQLWKQRITNDFTYHENLDLENLAYEYELTPEAITNILQNSMLKSLDRGEKVIQLNDLHNGIKKEFAKTSKSITIA